VQLLEEGCSVARFVGGDGGGCYLVFPRAEAGPGAEGLVGGGLVAVGTETQTVRGRLRLCVRLSLMWKWRVVHVAIALP
jgi:hypothetical protein